MTNLEFILKNNLVKNLEFAIEKDPPEYLVDSEKNVIGQFFRRTGTKMLRIKEDDRVYGQNLYTQVVTNNDFGVLDENFVKGVLEALQQENFIKLKPITIDIDEWHWLEMTIKMLKERPDYLVRYENHIHFCQKEKKDDTSLELDSHKLLWLTEGKEYDINMDVDGLILKDKENLSIKK